jgi:hypothetical protein
VEVAVATGGGGGIATATGGKGIGIVWNCERDDGSNCGVVGDLPSANARGIW